MQILRSKGKRRDQLCIMADILEITKEVTLKTQIMYRANLSFTQLNVYLSFLLNNLITPAISDGKEGYRTTENGVNFLRKHSELTRLLKSRSNMKVKIPKLNSEKQVTANLETLKSQS
jgi:predicted transcriptional regulator